MAPDTTPDLESGTQQLDLTILPSDELESLRKDIVTELNQRQGEKNLDEAETAELVNGQFVKWRALSAHANLKAVKPWILHVTGTHDEYGVDGDWLNKQQISGDYHMDIDELTRGDIIKVSGASHNNRKHRYYRILGITDNTLYYESKYGLDEATVIEEVA